MPVAISGNREDLEVFGVGGGVGRGGDFDFACSSSSLRLFSGRREIESESEAKRARVKWRVFRIIDFWLACTEGNLTSLFSIFCECEWCVSAVISGSLCLDRSLPC